MLFPPSERVVYEQNPLRQVICQLRFPPILAISAETPAVFQEAVRENFPLYETGHASPIPREIREIVEGLPGFPAGASQVVHKFLQEDSKHIISLTQDFISISTSDYERWENLKRDIELAKTALEDTYQPAFYQRIGLRYQNIIDREKLKLGSQTWTDLLRREFTGLLANDDIAAHVQETKSESLIQLDDIEDGYVRIRHGSNPTASNEFYIDSDFYVAERREHDTVIETLEKFNELDGNLFRWAICNTLTDALGEAD